MKLSETFNKQLDKLFDSVKDLDLSADERSALLDLKLTIVGHTIKYENKINDLCKTKPQYVIKLLEDGQFIGYVDYYTTDDKDNPTVPALVKDINEVENDVYGCLEAALQQINILQSTADAFAELNSDDPVITYEPEQRN